jgi:thioredoxin-related protein
VTTIRLAAALVLILALAGGGASAAGGARLGAHDLMNQPWFQETTGDLRRDLARAQADGRILVLLWEQEGCPYCLQMHQEAFRDPGLVDYLTGRFHVIQLNLWGERALTDLDGARRTEAEMARSHRVGGTPSLEFRVAGGQEVFRMPGYAPPPIFLGVLEYVATGGYEHHTIQTWFKAKARRAREEHAPPAVN